MTKFSFALLWYLILLIVLISKRRERLIPMSFGILHYYILAYKGNLSSSEMPRLMYISVVYQTTLYTRSYHYSINVALPARVWKTFTRFHTFILFAICYVINFETFGTEERTRTCLIYEGTAALVTVVVVVRSRKYGIAKRACD